MTCTTSDLQEGDIVTLRLSGLTGTGEVTSIAWPIIYFTFEGGHKWSFGLGNDEDEGIEVLDVKRAACKIGDYIQAKVGGKYHAVVDFNDSLNPVVVGQFGNNVVVYKIYDIYTAEEKAKNDALVFTGDDDGYNAANDDVNGNGGIWDIRGTVVLPLKWGLLKSKVVEALGEFAPACESCGLKLTGGHIGNTACKFNAPEPFCTQCAGPYQYKAYGGHWDTCPNRLPKYWVSEPSDVPTGHVKVFGKLMTIKDAKDFCRYVLDRIEGH